MLLIVSEACRALVLCFFIRAVSFQGFKQLESIKYKRPYYGMVIQIVIHDQFNISTIGSEAFKSAC